MLTSRRVHARLTALERALAPTGPTTCPECLGPVPGVNLMVCLTKKGKPRWGACRSCGLALNKDGRACAPCPMAPGKPRPFIPVIEPDRWWMFDAV